MQLRVVSDQPWNVPADVLALPFAGEPTFEGELGEIDRRAGGELYVWTVDDARRIRALEAIGVAGVITNDPRLFTAG